jgi:hypothetical protein
MGVGTVLLVISAGLSFLTHGCPRICLIPPSYPKRRLGSLTNRPYKSILIYGDNSTCEGKSIYSF